MRKAYKLDARAARDWMRLYHSSDPAKRPAKAARADVSITDMNFADTKFRNDKMSTRQPFRDPVAYIERMMLDYPGLFTGVGEITASRR